MNERMLAYCLKEAEVAIRMMAESKSPLHVFSYGKHPDGREFVFCLAIMPYDVAQKMFQINDWEDRVPGADFKRLLADSETIFTRPPFCKHSRRTRIGPGVGGTH